MHTHPSHFTPFHPMSFPPPFPPQIPESFADCLGGLLSVVGQNLSLKLEAQGGNTITAVHANRAVNWTTANKTWVEADFCLSSGFTCCFIFCIHFKWWMDKSHNHSYPYMPKECQRVPTLNVWLKGQSLLKIKTPTLEQTLVWLD